MKKGLKILMVFILAGALLVGEAVYTILSGKINLSSLDLFSTAFAEDVLMCNEIGNGVQFRLLRPGIIKEVLKRLVLDETELEDFITKTPPFGRGVGVGRGNPPIDNRGKPPIDKAPGEPPVDKKVISYRLGLMEEILNRLNLSVDEFRSALKDGKSLLEFAQSKGITKDELVTVVKEVVIQKINKLFSDGKITEKQKVKFLANLDDFVERFINVHGKKGPNGGRRGIGGFNYCPNIDN